LENILDLCEEVSAKQRKYQTPQLQFLIFQKNLHSMIFTKAVIAFILICCSYQQNKVNAMRTPKFVQPMDPLSKCEEQLTNYRTFVLQAILNFEDVCEVYTPHLNLQESLTAYFHKNHELESSSAILNMPSIYRTFQSSDQKADVWTFLKLVMSQFNDIEFATIIHDAVVERCQYKAQRDAKRNAVLLGKKQRFHAWGGKRSYPTNSGYSNSAATDEPTINDNSFYVA